MKRVCSLFLVMLSVTVCASGQQEGEVYRLGDTDRYVAAIKSDIFRFYVAEQEYDNWCWAACIQMVLNYQNVNISQCDIVRKAFGACINSPASCHVMQQAANGWHVEGVILESWEANHVSVYDLIDALAYKYPVIIGLNMPGQNIGHALVLTAIYYRYGDDDSKIPYAVVLRDPWPTNPSRVELSWDDFSSRINCIVHVTR